MPCPAKAAVAVDQDGEHLRGPDRAASGAPSQFQRAILLRADAASTTGSTTPGGWVERHREVQVPSIGQLGSLE